MTASTDDPRVNDALADLRAWSDALPTYDVDAGAARHVVLVAQGAAPVGATAVVRGSRRLWWIVGGSAVIALGLVSAWPRAPEPAAPERAFAVAPTPPAPARPVERVAVAAPIVEAPIADAPRSDAIATAPRRASRSRADVEPAVTTVATEDPPDALERELAIVRRMRGALADEPRRVLELAKDADREVGRGVFAEERAALRVFALARLDDTRTDAAAAAFLREFGEGPFAARVSKIADDEAPTAAPQ